MKKILLNLFLLTYTFTTFSQTVSVRILDNIDGTPLENIKVEKDDLPFKKSLQLLTEKPMIYIANVDEVEILKNKHNK